MRHSSAGRQAHSAAQVPPALPVAGCRLSHSALSAALRPSPVACRLLRRVRRLLFGPARLLKLPIFADLKSDSLLTVFQVGEPAALRAPDL